MNKLKEYPPTLRMNGVNGPFRDSWYPQSRPLQHYRLTGNTTTTLNQMNNTFWTFLGVIISVQGREFQYEEEAVTLINDVPIFFVLQGKTYRMTFFGDDISWSVSDGSTAVWRNLNGTTFPCQVPPTYVKQYKMLGKNEAGIIKSLDCAKQGSILSFSGRAAIRPTSAVPSTQYYADTSQYLRSRGNTFAAKSITHKVPNVVYANSGGIVWPALPQTVPGYDAPLNSAWFQGTGAETKCNLTVFKPNNYKYSVQGAVSSGARLDRLKVNLTETPKKFQNKKCCKFKQ